MKTAGEATRATEFQEPLFQCFLEMQGNLDIINIYLFQAPGLTVIFLHQLLKQCIGHCLLAPDMELTVTQSPTW